MAYTGSIDLIAGLRPKNGASFPLINAPDVLVDETNDKRLSKRLDELQNGIDGRILISAQPSKDSTMTQEVGIDSNGKLWTAPGGIGVTDYSDITGKPQINSVVLSGNQKASDLGLAAANDIPSKWDGSYIGGSSPTVTTVVNFQVTLTTNGWTNGVQTVTNVLFLSTGYAYFVSPSGSSRIAYKAAGVYADDLTADGSLTFHCDTAPASALTVNIMRAVSR